MATNIKSPASLPDGMLGQEYIFEIEVENLLLDGQYTITSGVLPPGLTLFENTVVVGVPTEVGSFPFMFKIADKTGKNVANKMFTLVIKPGHPILAADPVLLVPDPVVPEPIVEPESEFYTREKLLSMDFDEQAADIAIKGKFTKAQIDLIHADNEKNAQDEFNKTPKEKESESKPESESEAEVEAELKQKLVPEFDPDPTVFTRPEVRQQNNQNQYIEPHPAERTNRADNWKRFIILALLLAIVIGGFWWIISSSIKNSNEKNAIITTAPEVTEAPDMTEVATEVPTEVVTEAATPEPTETETTAATETTPVVSSDGKTLAEQIWGESLPDQPEMYAGGGDGFPEICAGLCWDTSKLDQGIMKWYGPWNGEEDISQSDAAFGDGSTGPLELMRSGKVTKVIFYLGKEAQLETCAIGSLDGKPLSEVLGIKSGECGDRVGIKTGWHVIENNANSPISGFGVRLSASGWAGLTESQIVEYTKYWKISGDTATWVGPSDVEIMMTPSMVQMMQDFDVLHTIVFTTNVSGQVFFCNGSVSGDATLSSKDGSCQLFDVPAGTFTYAGTARLSAGISWNK